MFLSICFSVVPREKGGKDGKEEGEVGSREEGLAGWGRRRGREVPIQL